MHVVIKDVAVVIDMVVVSLVITVAVSHSVSEVV